MKRIAKKYLVVVAAGCVVAASAQTKFPLKVDIDVSTKQSSKSIGAGLDGSAKMEQTQVRVKIRKSGGSPYNDQLIAELYVIGRQLQTGYYGIIDVVKKEFKFSADKDNAFEFESPVYALGRTDGNINVGGVYETYLLVVVDKDGKIIDTRSGRVIHQKGIDLIRELGPMTLFDRDGNIIGKLENPGEALKQAIPAAVNPGNDY